MLRYIVSVIIGIFTWIILVFLVSFLTFSASLDAGGLILVFGNLFAAFVVGFISASIARKRKIIVAIVTMTLGYLLTMFSVVTSTTMLNTNPVGNALIMILQVGAMHVAVAVAGAYLSKSLLSKKLIKQ